MLAAAIVAAGMSPLALLLNDFLGHVRADGNDYYRAIISPAFAVGFAYTGSRVVFGLGREVAAARELGAIGWRRGWGRTVWERCGKRGTTSS